VATCPPLRYGPFGGGGRFGPRRLFAYPSGLTRSATDRNAAASSAVVHPPTNAHAVGGSATIIPAYVRRTSDATSCHDIPSAAAAP